MRFLQKITELAEPGCVFYHWGDMDYGGIRIFQFIKKNLFPGLLPYKMTVNDFEQAVNAGAGIALEAEKAQKLKRMDAGILEELKEKILETNLTIEQEKLLALDLHCKVL